MRYAFNHRVVFAAKDYLVKHQARERLAPAGCRMEIVTMSDSKVFPAREVPAEQAVAYQELALNEHDYLKLLSTGHPGGKVSFAQASYGDADSKLGSGDGQ